VGSQELENKGLSRDIIGKSAPILAEITIRKSQNIASERENAFFLKRNLPFDTPLSPDGDGWFYKIDILNFQIG
jgi:hypothetical protein